MLIDKDLRLSISGCFWLFYASKYTIRSYNTLAKRDKYISLLREGEIDYFLFFI